MLFGGTSDASADDACPDDGIAIEYVAPTHPGDAYQLSYLVPEGHASAVIVMDASDSTEPTLEDYAGAMLVPVTPDPATGLVTIAGVIPADTPEEWFTTSPLEFRVVLVEPSTGEIQLSLPFPVVPKEQPPGTQGDPDVGEDALSAADLVSVSDDDDDGSEDYAQKSGSNSSSAGSLGKASGNALSFTIPFVTLTSTSFILAVHDQPTPIHGSGH